MPGLPMWLLSGSNDNKSIISQNGGVKTDLLFCGQSTNHSARKNSAIQSMMVG